MHPYRISPEQLEAFRISPNDPARIAILVDPKTAGRSLTAFLEIHEPGGRIPWHSHRRAVEVFFVLRGAATFHCDQDEVHLRTGDCLMIPAHGRHDIVNTGPSRLYLLTLMVPNEAFVELVRRGIPAPLDAEDVTVLRNL
jgi:mannose-6-phosphate isomerase-like protein (cupin superfamily)